MQCEFEEKQYEQILNMELAWKSRVFPSGQILENTLGIDAALMSRNLNFWKIWSEWGHIAPPMGVYLQRELWEDAEKKLNDYNFPRFKYNLFVQHKRPEFISSKLGKEYPYWQKPYFRYYLYEYQLQILLYLEQQVKSNAIVIYACPAFWTNKELFETYFHQIIENSNYVKPHQLQHHSRYTFSASGKQGKAFSDPERIESVELIEEIRKLVSQRRDYQNNSELIYHTSKIMFEILMETQRFTNFIELINRYSEYMHRLAIAVMKTQIFTSITNLCWSIGL